MTWLVLPDVTVTNGSATITINDSADIASVLPGYDFWLDGKVYEIQDKSTAATPYTLTLAENWTGTTQNNISAKVKPNHAPLADKLLTAIDRLSSNSDTFETFKGAAFKAVATPAEALEGKEGVLIDAKSGLELVKNSTYKNYIVNNDMAVNQENGDGPNTVSAGGAPYYICDEFYTTNSTGSGAVLQSEVGLINGAKTSKITAITAATDLSGSLIAGRITIKLESSHVYRLNGKNSVLAFPLNTNFSGYVSVCCRKQDGSRSFVSDLQVATGLNHLSLIIPFESDTVVNQSNDLGLLIDIGLCTEGVYKGESINNDTWQNGLILCTEQSTQWSKTQGRFIELVGEVQLLEGTVAPRYEPYTHFIYNVFRYFYKNVFSSDAALFDGNPGEISTRINNSYSFPVPMRITPISSSDYTGAIQVNTRDSSIPIPTSNTTYDIGSRASAPGRAYLYVVSGNYVQFNARL